MGFFGGSKTFVSTSVNRVLDEKQYPETLRSAVIGAVMSGGSVADRITEDLLNGPALQMDRMYHYAKKHYPFGVPTQEYVNSGANRQAAQNYIQSLYTGSLDFSYVRLEGLDFTHIGWQTLADDYGYVFDTNEITALSVQKGTPVYLDNIKAYHYLPPAQEEQDNYYGGFSHSFSPSPTSGYTPERRIQDIKNIADQALATDYEIIDSGEDHVRIFYVYRQGGTTQRDYFDIPLTSYDMDSNYYHAMFRETTADGEQVHFFTYEQGSGTHPTLDRLNQPDYVDTGRYFPFLFFRQYRQNLADESRHDSELYKASVRMAKYMNLDYQAFSEAIHESPDIDDIFHAVLMMGVPANSDDPYELKYLFDFFKRVHQQDRDNGDAWMSNEVDWGLFNRGVAQVPKAVSIRDGGFKMALGFREVIKRTKAGKLGEVGTVDRQQGHKLLKTLVNKYDDMGQKIGTEIREEELPYQRYRKQITPFFYEEITVVGLVLRYDVYKNYDVVADAHDSKLLIPIDRDITDTYNLIEKENIYFRSMHMVYNAKVKKSLKWYETGFFKVVMIVIAVVITIWSGGGAAGLLAAAAAQGAVALAIAVLQIVAITIAANYAFKLVVRELGLEAAMVLAVVLTAVSFGTNMAGSSNAFMGISSETLMQVATGLAKGVAAESKRQASEYVSENEEFDLMKQEKMEELEVAKDLLEMDSLIDPFEFIGLEPVTLFGESPDDFYNRTTHSGNIGTVVYEHIHNYVDINLQLPDFHKTMGEHI